MLIFHQLLTILKSAAVPLVLNHSKLVCLLLLCHFFTSLIFVLQMSHMILNHNKLVYLSMIRHCVNSFVYLPSNLGGIQFQWSGFEKHSNLLHSDFNTSPQKFASTGQDIMANNYVMGVNYGCLKIVSQQNSTYQTPMKENNCLKLSQMSN